ncbi:UTP--glucose-1-phosphate uridylyltransferase [Nocardioides cavernaquae]|uniref:UTP--glucose-1-phosphate uridylyltransferase n=1 Tax=Nocardioides cavernaquae TaxID=2321396 RepID=A0A3A5H962_9ACTN|nr:UTP--glucose-1-phosphate uridylyltransferase [Nocardioides cavernaquae]RJS45915.1 UTP--glucose-1-phosphate uridylyltransferase [Nocardioides cavernaquae]
MRIDVTRAEGRIRERMIADGLSATAIEVFVNSFLSVSAGATGLMPESSIGPLGATPRLDDLEWDGSPDGLARTAVLKLNGGLGTSMGLDKAKSLLPARDGMTFLDVIARQVLAGREAHGVALPLTFMDSFRTAEDSMAWLASYPDLAVGNVPLSLMQNRVPKLRSDDLTPVSWVADPSLEWCPPGHGDIYTVFHTSGFLDLLLEAGFTQLFVSNADNLAAWPDPRIAAWFAASGSPFAVEAVRRTPSDRKGGHFVRRVGGGITLRETSQVPPEDARWMADLERHHLASTNNIWIDVAAMRDLLRERDGVLGLPLIRNAKTVDPTDKTSTPVIQIETAMGAAIGLFDGASVIEVGRDRFLPVKTSDDLIILRSDCVTLDEALRPVQMTGDLPFVALDDAYKFIFDFEARFPAGVPSLIKATSLVVEGDWTFGEGIRVVGVAQLGPEGGKVPDGALLSGEAL